MDGRIVLINFYIFVFYITAWNNIIYNGMGNIPHNNNKKRFEKYLNPLP